jgi:hypothetical protein
MAQVVVEPRLDKSDNKQWYVAAAQGTDTIEVAYLDGMIRHIWNSRRASPLMVSPGRCALMQVWPRWITAGWSSRVGHKSRGGHGCRFSWVLLAGGLPRAALAGNGWFLNSKVIIIIR